MLNCPDKAHLGPPLIHPQLVALRAPFWLSSELCGCAALQLWMDSGLSLLVSRVADGVLKDHLSLLLCPGAVGLCLWSSPRFIFPMEHLLPTGYTDFTPVACLWHLTAFKQHHAGAEFHILGQVCSSALRVSLQLRLLPHAGHVLQQAGGAAWRKAP